MIHEAPSTPPSVVHCQLPIVHCPDAARAAQGSKGRCRSHADSRQGLAVEGWHGGCGWRYMASQVPPGSLPLHEPGRTCRQGTRLRASVVLAGCTCIGMHWMLPPSFLCNDLGSVKAPSRLHQRNKHGFSSPANSGIFCRIQQPWVRHCAIYIILYARARHHSSQSLVAVAVGIAVADLVGGWMAADCLQNADAAVPARVSRGCSSRLSDCTNPRPTHGAVSEST